MTRLATKPKTKVTAYQMDVMRVILAANPEPDESGSLEVDIDQILERIAKKGVIKQSMQLTLRSLIHNGMVDKLGRSNRRGRSRAVYKLTELGTLIARGTPRGPAFVEATGLDAELEELEKDF